MDAREVSELDIFCDGSSLSAPIKTYNVQFRGAGDSPTIREAISSHVLELKGRVDPILAPLQKRARNTLVRVEGADHPMLVENIFNNIYVNAYYTSLLDNGHVELALQAGDTGRSCRRAKIEISINAGGRRSSGRGWAKPKNRVCSISGYL
jgi:hypothetical protein